MIRQYELVEMVRGYDPAADEGLINKAYVFGIKAHAGQTRASGDPYFSHPLEVAGILTELKLDSATIVTALLHDTIEDTVATRSEIEQEFGREVATLVDGVTKLSKLNFDSESAKQAENFRKLLVAMSSDIRVLLVKLADRLHNMRTLHHIQKPEKRVRIAHETMDIYAPLAGRIGMQTIREELEDLAFGEINPDARASINAQLERAHKEAGDLVSRIALAIRLRLQEGDLKAEIEAREKRPYSIWRKLQRKEISFEELSDVFGFRIIVPDAADCYRALGLIHTHWSFVPERFKDFISTPKRNGYRSIHTSVIGPENRPIELQIRTAEMHAIAEMGVAAHWRYKEEGRSADGGPSRGHASIDDEAYRWLRGLVDMIEHGASPEEFLEHTKLEMFLDQVFCFTPKGHLIGLPRGATPIDFAYAVHTDVGDTCVGARINGRQAPLRTELRNGDRVEILRSPAQTPQPGWAAIVATGRARSAIRRHARHAEREHYQRHGGDAARQAIRTLGLAPSDKAFAEAAGRLASGDVDDMFERVGRGRLSGRAVAAAAFPGVIPEEDHLRETAATTPRRGPASQRPPVRGLHGHLANALASCCTPTPGDRIVGLEGPEGVVIHAIDCAVLGASEDSDDAWLDLAWDMERAKGERFVTSLILDVANAPGALGAITTLIAKHEANIEDLRFTARNPDFYAMKIDITVRDTKHLTDILAGLRATDVVAGVERARGQVMSAN